MFLGKVMIIVKRIRRIFFNKVGKRYFKDVIIFSYKYYFINKRYGKGFFILRNVCLLNCDSFDLRSCYDGKL